MDWYLSKQGFDTISEWNAYLGTSDVDGSNIGSQLYPFRTLDILETTLETNITPANGDNVYIMGGRWLQTDIVRATASLVLNYYGLGYTEFYFLYNLNFFLKNKFLSGETFNNLKWIEESVLLGTTYNVEVLSLTFNNCEVISILLNNCTFNSCLVRPVFSNHAGLGSIIAYQSTVYCDIKTPRGYYIAGEYSIFKDIANTPAASTVTPLNHCCIIGSNAGNATNFHSDPQFNDEENEDFTLKTGSPCLTEKNKLVGRYGAAYQYKVSDSVFSSNQGAILSNLEELEYIENGIKKIALVLSSGQTLGTVETSWIDLGDIRSISRINSLGNNLYDLGGNFVQVIDEDMDNDKQISVKFATTEAEKSTATWTDLDISVKLSQSARFVKVLLTIRAI